MIHWKAIRGRIFHWRSLLAVAALGNLGFSSGLAYETLKESIEKRKIEDEVGAAFFCIMVFFNVFSLINVFFFRRVTLQIFLAIIFGVDAAAFGFFGFVLGLDFIQNLKSQSKSDLVVWALLVLVSVLSLFSTSLLLWKLDRPGKFGQGSEP